MGSRALAVGPAFRRVDALGRQRYHAPVDTESMPDGRVRPGRPGASVGAGYASA